MIRPASSGIFGPSSSPPSSSQLLAQRALGGWSRAISFSNLRWRLIAFKLLFRCCERPSLARLGSKYGGWTIPRESLNASSVCYLAGVGKDITFDLALLSEYNCKAWAFDPTPGVIEWIAQQPLPENYTFLSVGVAGKDGIQRFYEPKNSEHVSHSIENLQKTSNYFEAECLSLETIRCRLGHQNIDLVKLDVEGAQHAILENMIEDRLFPRVICVEMDQPEKLRKSRETVTKLRRAGYDLVSVDGFNLTFHLSGLK